MVSINYAEIKPCNEEPCIVHSGQDATVMINFDASKMVFSSNNNILVPVYVYLYNL